MYQDISRAKFILEVKCIECSDESENKSHLGLQKPPRCPGDAHVL